MVRRSRRARAELLLRQPIVQHPHEVHPTSLLAFHSSARSSKFRIPDETPITPRDPLAYSYEIGPENTLLSSEKDHLLPDIFALQRTCAGPTPRPQRYHTSAPPAVVGPGRRATSEVGDHIRSARRLAVHASTGAAVERTPTRGALSTLLQRPASLWPGLV